MGTLTINSAAIIAPSMSYDDYYSNSNRNTCNTGSSFNQISFNATGGYRTGFNFTGATPATLRLLSYSDIMVEMETGQPDSLMSGYTPSVLEDSGNNPISFPYDIPLASSSVGNVGITQSIATPELLCPSNPVNTVQRRRILTYQVIDTGGNLGPVREARLDLTYVPVI